MLLGMLIFLASCVFWVFCTFLPVFGLGILIKDAAGKEQYEMNWYSWVCFGWSALGMILMTTGCWYEMCCKKTPFAREAKIADVDPETLLAPTHYIMIA